MSFAAPFIAPVLGSLASGLVAKKLAPKPPKQPKQRALPTVQDAPGRDLPGVADINQEGIQGSVAEQQKQQRRRLGRAGTIAAGRGIALEEQAQRVSARLLG